jgi:uncharacterized membrane-anchored protein YhcB (DUF1043 family)
MLAIVGIIIAIIIGIIFARRKHKLVINQWNKIYNQSDKIWN